MKQPKSQIDKRYEDKHKEERKAAHAVWGTSMKREDFEELNKFLKSHHIQKTAQAKPRFCASATQFVATATSAVGICAIIKLFALKNCAKGGRAAKNHGKSQPQNRRDLREHIVKGGKRNEKRT